MTIYSPLQRISRFFWVVLSALIIANPSFAQELPSTSLLVSGQALIIDGDAQTALLRAVLDALRTAAIQRKAQLTSYSSLNAQGQLSENISLHANLNIRHLDLVEQWTDQGMARVTLSLALDETEQECQPPQLTQIVTTDLAVLTGNSSYHQVDINQLLLDAETQFSKLARSVNLQTHRINPALNTYQTAWLASEANNQADYHLTLGAKWAPHVEVSPHLKVFKNLSWPFFDQTKKRTKLLLTASFSSPHLPHIDLLYEQEFSLQLHQPLGEASQSISQELSQKLAKWVNESWHHIYPQVVCEGSYIKLTKIIDQPLWRINKGQELGLKQDQTLLLLPLNYANGMLNPDAKSAPHIFKVTVLQPHSAVLEHIAGPDNVTATTAQVILF